MTTLLDVAKKANVSKMTVSRVINHPDKVTDELKQVVYEAMRELDYHPNVIAKALANNSTRIVKLCILEDIDTTEPYYMNLMIGIAKILDLHQYSLQLVTRRNFDIGNCDGYIITGMRINDVEWIKKLKKPVILFGENRYGLDYVDTNNKAGTYLLSQLALKKGYEKLIYIGIDSKESFEYSREAGYLQQVQEKQMIPELHRFGNHSHMSEEFVENNWDNIPKNTAFICASDRLAIGIERGIIRCGGKIPEDFGVTGFDGVFLNQIASPKITTIKQSIIEMGSACGENLLDKIQNAAPQGSLVFEPKISLGGTLRN
ncbi:LacI family DNA-binding transcriptional regulator [Companilactobacillus alimentarius]|uniref:LacI family transcriptional regulator n=1 Tax=Companilactobacillus alimentarius DSM 20249 TaxID=1423720 RepID=A0A2K9HHS3_9LACO|nr:LacI family DNA-binding transcriptional regulator [Companilactobacillus alimentarius]AUI71336.1 LacI family transcriptional regulator [Companilactobacillus alimentarius DSM 20249]GEO44318.1 LacI family transcriptional regulator [Companilactobacillus alimentarius]